MKICIFTDNHFCSNSSIIRSKGEKYSTRLENQIASLNWVNELAVSKQCDQLICLGDFFDSSTLNSEELSALKEIRWNDLPKKFIVGNHEMGSSDLTLNSTNALSQLGDVIYQPTQQIGFGYRLIFLPYILETDRKPLKSYIWEATIDNWETQEIKNTIILSHNDIAGIRYGQWESKAGFSVDEIDESCDLFINGHLHNQSQINEKILNLGNLTGQNFSEDAFKYSHCAAILDTTTMKVELINNPYAFNFYKLEPIDLDDLLNKIGNLDNSNSIATVKICAKDIDQARMICDKYLKEYRLISVMDKVVTSAESSQIINVDHIEQFKQYVVNKIGSSEILIEELDNLK